MSQNESIVPTGPKRIVHAASPVSSRSRRVDCSRRSLLLDDLSYDLVRLLDGGAEAEEEPPRRRPIVGSSSCTTDSSYSARARRPDARPSDDALRRGRPDSSSPLESFSFSEEEEKRSRKPEELLRSMARKCRRCAIRRPRWRRRAGRTSRQLDLAKNFTTIFAAKGPAQRFPRRTTPPPAQN